MYYSRVTARFSERIFHDQTNKNHDPGYWHSMFFEIKEGQGQLGGLGERCELPHRVRGGASNAKTRSVSESQSGFSRKTSAHFWRTFLVIQP